ncbi:MAG: hypothetical protein E7327_03295 [Clostridiales bacterium]|nr:hypothetical protein [Clostridiales bacterium]
MKKQLALLWLALICCVCISAYAETITSTEGFTIDASGVITDYTGTDVELSIPNEINGVPVTEIGDRSFEGCTGLESVTIPNGVTSIGFKAFYNCTDLERVILPESVNYIDFSAFEKCANMTSITMPGSLRGLSTAVFADCSSLKEIVIPAGLYTIDSCTFMNCSSLTGVTIPETVRSINNHAFYGCSSLTELVISDSVRTIGASAFQNCSGLTSLTLPRSMTSLDASAIKGCSSLKSIALPEGVTTFDRTWLDGCTALESITLPGSLKSVGYDSANSAFGRFPALKQVILRNGITTIHQYTFEGCSNLTSITLPDTLTTIGGSAFYDCTALETITLPEGVTTIGAAAFDSCTSLTDITIPSSVNSVGRWGFNGCTNLTNIYSADITSWLNISFENTTANPLANGGKLYFSDVLATDIAVPYGVTTIGNNAFYGYTGLTSITVPESVTSIGSEAFRGCSNLVRVKLSEGVTSIANYAFWGCTSLTEITMAKGLTSIGYGAFSNCTSLNTIAIPEDVVEIGYEAFKNCSGLQSISFSDGLKSIGYSAFMGCVNLKDVYAPSVEAWLNIEFQTNMYATPMHYASNLYLDGELVTNLVIPEGVSNIGPRAFYRCKSLTSVTIPESLTSIEKRAFTDCASLTSIIIPASVTSIGEFAFSGCPDELVIYGMTGSRAQSYAAENNITFVALDAEDTLPAPQNPSWKTGSTATATWDAVDGADYYELIVYVYDEAGTTLLGTTTTGTSTNEVDVQLEANTIIKQQETEYTTVKLAYTVKAGVADDKGGFTYGDESAMAEMLDYTYALIQLKAPEKVVLNEDCTLMWSSIENAIWYRIDIYAQKPGHNGTSKGHTYEFAYINEVTIVDGMLTLDLTSRCEEAYGSAVKSGYIENGDTAEVYIQISSQSDNDHYLASDEATSNSINYYFFTPVESITLSPAKPVVYVGNSYYLGKTITPEDGHYTTIDWRSTNTGVVTVSEEGLIKGVAAGDAQVTAAIGDVKTTVPVKVYTISSNIESDKDKDHVTDSAGDIIDDIINNPDPDLGDTDIPQEDMEDIKDQVTDGIWRGDEFFTDMKWYEENFEKYRDNWGQIQKAARELNEELDVQFAGAYNITVEMYHKDKEGSDHKIGCIEEFENEITFTFDLFSSMNEVQTGYARRYILVRIHRNEIEVIDMEVENGKGKAKSNGFSDFVVLYVDEPIGSVDLTGLKTLKLPAALTVIEDEAFVGIAAEVVVIPASCTSIGSHAFADCPNLKYIVMPKGGSITTANDAFEGCNAVILYK